MYFYGSKMSDNDDEEAVRWAKIFKKTIKESDEDFKVRQNTFNIKWRMLSISLKL